MLNEWEFTFLTILCNAIYDERRISAVVPTLQVPFTILNDAALVHGLPTEQDALTAHILFKWWCSAPISLTEKLTRLQCTFTGIGLGPSYYTALKSYGRFLYHFSSSPVAQTPPDLPCSAPGRPGWPRVECGCKQRFYRWPPCLYTSGVTTASRRNVSG